VGRKEMHTGVGGETLIKQTTSKTYAWEDNIIFDVKSIGWREWNGLIWLRIWTSGGLL
jgi:hypothetical protein